jgi:hypothetical protein
MGVFFSFESPRAVSTSVLSFSSSAFSLLMEIVPFSTPGHEAHARKRNKRLPLGRRKAQKKENTNSAICFFFLLFRLTSNRSKKTTPPFRSSFSFFACCFATGACRSITASLPATRTRKRTGVKQGTRAKKSNMANSEKNHRKSIENGKKKRTRSRDTKASTLRFATSSLEGIPPSLTTLGERLRCLPLLRPLTPGPGKTPRAETRSQRKKA